MSTAQLNKLGTYATGIFAESAAEIVAFDPTSDRLFVTNGADFTIDVIDVSNPNNPTKVNAIALNAFGGGVNSVAVKNGIVAVAVEAEVKQDPGTVVFFDTDGNLISSVEVGALPDALTFTPDGQRVVVANEGEPSDDYTVDAEGSVSIIDLSGGVGQLTQQNVLLVSFDQFDKQMLIDQGIRIFGPGASVSQDLEPEFVAITPDSKTAWVTLQENNALAKIDLASGQVELLPLGLKDYSLPGNGIDPSNEDGGINIRPVPVFGLYQPDTIATYRANGQTYLVTANEGDARDYSGFSEEARVGDLVLDPVAFPNAAELQRDENLGRLKVTTTLGDTDGDGDYDELYAYGGRSFSIWDEDGNLIFDSGDALEQITAAQVPGGFNSDDEENAFDDRSDDKGPEPEALAIGQVGGKTFAFIGLERTSGIVVYDITNPRKPHFEQYINDRNFEVPIMLPDGSVNPAVGDVSPEGLTFVSAADSPTGRPLLVAAQEISGTTTVYDVGPIIQGQDGKDKLKGTDGADFIRGGGGEDKLEGKKGDDSLFGGDGDDELKDDQGNNFLYGEAGNDKLEAKEGNNLLDGGAGNDELKAEKGNNRLYGGAGNDKLEAKEGDNLLVGGTGKDELKAGKGNDILIGVDPTQPFAGRGEIDELIGKDGDRYVLGDANQVFYDDGDVNSAGLYDYAYISKFDGKKGDVIQLKGDASMYALGSGSDKNEKTLLLAQGGQFELIALIDGKELSSLTGGSFDYV